MDTPPVTDTRMETEATPDQASKLVISPRGGPPGTEVTMRMGGLPSFLDLAIGFGDLGSGYEILADAKSDADGEVAVTVMVPPRPDRSGSHYFFLTDMYQQRPMTVSDVFHVTGADGLVRVQGKVTDEGGDCVTLRGRNNELYLLVGETGALEAGQSVSVEGLVTETPACPDGLTIRVQRVQVVS